MAVVNNLAEAHCEELNRPVRTRMPHRMAGADVMSPLSRFIHKLETGAAGASFDGEADFSLLARLQQDLVRFRSQTSRASPHPKATLSQLTLRNRASSVDLLFFRSKHLIDHLDRIS
jgi:hypothetical protein